MSSGATYSVVPFVNKRAVGSVAGIVGAGGNIGAVAAGMLFRSGEIAATVALAGLGVAVIASGFLALLLNFEREATASDLRFRAAVEPAAAE